MNNNKKIKKFYNLNQMKLDMNFYLKWKKIRK